MEEIQSGLKERLATLRTKSLQTPAEYLAYLPYEMGANGK
jgi:hypothetical protein